MVDEATAGPINYKIGLYQATAENWPPDTSRLVVYKEHPGRGFHFLCEGTFRDILAYAREHFPDNVDEIWERAADLHYERER